MIELFFEYLLPIITTTVLLLLAFAFPDDNATITLLAQGTILLAFLIGISYYYGDTYQFYMFLAALFGMWSLVSHYRMTRSWRRKFKYWNLLFFAFIFGFAISIGELIREVVLRFS